MLIRPQHRILENILDLSEFSNVSRTIIFYVKDLEDGFAESSCDVVLVNNSTQTGNIGGKLVGKQKLHSTNIYYGTAVNPFIGPPTLGRINPYGLLFFEEFQYTHKLVDWMTDKDATISIYDNLETGESLKYKNKDAILPSDPRYYNLDHQMVKLNNDAAFNTNVQFGDPDPLTQEQAVTHLYYELIGHSPDYMLNELIDPVTQIKITKLSYESSEYITMGDIVPNRFGHISLAMGNHIYEITSRILHWACHAFFDAFLLIFDMSDGPLGGKRLVPEYTRISMSMPKEERRFALAEFANEIEEEWSFLCDMNYNIRLTISHNLFATRVKVDPLPPSPGKNHLLSEGYSKRILEKNVCLHNIISELCGEDH